MMYLQNGWEEILTSTAVILAGGKSSRMQRDKPALRFGEMTLLEWAINRFSASFDKVYVSVADAGNYPDAGVELIEDIYKDCGPMAGLHAALLRAEDDGVFLVAVDMPFASPDAANCLIAMAGLCDACVLSGQSSAYEPLFGYYSKTILPYVQNCLASGKYKMAELLEQANVRLVSPSELGALWSDRLFLNINYPEDYDRMKDILF